MSLPLLLERDGSHSTKVASGANKRLFANRADGGSSNRAFQATPQRQFGVTDHLGWYDVVIRKGVPYVGQIF